MVIFKCNGVGINWFLVTDAAFDIKFKAFMARTLLGAWA